jgi:hypothetical protein
MLAWHQEPTWIANGAKCAYSNRVWSAWGQKGDLSDTLVAGAKRNGPTDALGTGSGPKQTTASCYRSVLALAPKLSLGFALLSLGWDLSLEAPVRRKGES